MSLILRGHNIIADGTWDVPESVQGWINNHAGVRITLTFANGEYVYLGDGDTDNWDGGGFNMYPIQTITVAGMVAGGWVSIKWSL